MPVGGHSRVDDLDTVTLRPFGALSLCSPTKNYKQGVTNDY